MTDDTTFPEVDDSSPTERWTPALQFFDLPIRVPATSPVPDRSVVDALETVEERAVRL